VKRAHDLSLTQVNNYLASYIESLYIKKNNEMKRLLLIFTVIVISTQLHAGVLDSLSIGVGGGFESYNTPKGEVYLKSDLVLLDRKAELRVGMNNRTYQLDFDNVKDLEASSIGFFGDICIYPFNKGLFTGIRWELINFNWLTSNSKAKVEDARDYSPTSIYTGTCMFFQLGYNFQLSKKVGIKLYAQPGLQQFSISNGSFSSGSYVQNDATSDLIKEDHYKFIYNLNLSIDFRIR